MEKYYYLIALIISLSGLLAGDFMRRLVFFRNFSASIKILLIGLGFFVLWDVLGIVLGVFATNQKWVSGAHIITPNFPIEEILFLSLLIYVSMLAWRLLCSRTF